MTFILYVSLVKLLYIEVLAENRYLNFMTVCNNLFTVPTIPVLPQHPYFLPRIFLTAYIPVFDMAIYLNLAPTLGYSHLKIG